MTAEVMSFSGHESFPLRYGWLKKCVDAVASDPAFFSRDDAMVPLGVGKNMVRSIRHWALTARVIDSAPNDPRGLRGLHVTPLGAMLFGPEGVDPYLEDVQTLWLIHWLITTHPERATTWRWAFGEWGRQDFSRDELLRDLAAYAGGGRATAATLARDAEVLLRTYLPTRASRAVPAEDALDGPLTELRLLREDASGRCEFARGPKPSLGEEVFAFALLEFWERTAPDRDTLAADALLQRPGAPGRVFRLDAASLALRLEDAERWSRGAVFYDDTAGLRQLLRRKRPEPIAWLGRALRAARGGAP
ncbi:MAG: DUF4007 family protein [Polyangiales bacterium]